MSEESFLRRIRQLAAEDNLVKEGDRLLVGVSGGVDSMVLLHAMLQIGAACEALHVNYGLRGDESDGDEAFVKRTCSDLGVPFVAVRPDTGWHAAGSSLQESARTFRYTAFALEAANRGIRKVALAHHADDQAETVLLRMMRGAGPAGVVAMRHRRPIERGSKIEVIRPFLDVSRTDIVAWADAQEIAFRSDRSNEDETFDRVRLRKRIMPVLREAFGDAAVTNIARTARQSQGAFDAVILPALDAILASEEHALSINALEVLDPSWRKLVLLDAARRWLPGVADRASVATRIDDLLLSQSGRRVDVKGGTIWRDRDTLVFETSSKQDEVADTIVKEGERVLIADGVFQMTRVDRADLSDRGNPYSECVSVSVFDEPLTIGPWRVGDRFVPLGMTGSKKVSDVLTDARVPSQHRKGALVLRSGDRIVWVVGHRIADCFKLSTPADEAVVLTFSRSLN